MYPVPGNFTVTNFTVDGGYYVELVGSKVVGVIFYHGFIDGFQSIKVNYNCTLRYIMIDVHEFQNG